MRDERLELLGRIARGLGDGAAVRIALHPSQWSWNPRTRTLTVGMEDLRDSSLEACLGFVAHEIGHCAISRYLDLGDAARPEQMPRDLWHHMQNALEDPRVEGWMLREFPGSAAWLADLHSRPPPAVADLDTWTLQFMFGSLLEWTRQWRADAGQPLPVVAASLLATRGERQAYWRTWPTLRGLSGGDRQSAIDGSAQQALVLARAVAAELLKLRESEALALAWALEQRPALAARATDAVRTVDGAGCVQVRRDAAPLMDARGVPPPFQPQASTLVLAGGVLAHLERRSLKKIIRVRIVLVGESDDGDPSETRAKSAPSDELLGLVRAERKRPPRLGQLPPDTSQLSRQLRRALERLFPLVTERAWTGGHSSGRRIDLHAAMQLPADPNAATRLWMRRSEPTRPEAAVLLLVDLSGSMARDGRIAAAILATHACVEALKGLELPCGVVGFQDEIIDFVEFDEPWSADLRQRIADMAREVEGRRTNGHNCPGHNDDGPCLMAAADQLLRRPERQRVLLVISDGRPAGRRSTPEDLHAAVARLSGRAGLVLAAIGIGEGTDHVAEFYPDAQVSVPVDQFPAVLARTLAQRLRRARVYAAG